MKVKECMCNQVSWVEPQTTLSDVAKIMQKEHVGCIPVCDTNQTIVGLVTDRDIVLRGVACNKDTNTTPVSEIMTTNVYTISANDEVTDASKLMTDWQIKRVPVIENARIVGIITLGDLTNTKGVDGRQAYHTLEGINQNGTNAQNAE